MKAYLSDGDGTFRESWSTTFGGYYNPSVGMGDIDGDGLLDVVVSASKESNPHTVIVKAYQNDSY